MWTRTSECLQALHMCHLGSSWSAQEEALVKFVSKGNWVLPCGKAPWRRRVAELCEDRKAEAGFPAQGAVWRRAHHQLSLSQHIFQSKYSPR